jgi:hypothetical protein
MEDWVEKLIRWAQLGMLGAFGGSAAYIHAMATKNQPFRVWAFAANVFLAFFVGKMLGGLIPFSPTYIEYRDGVVMALGFCAYPILGVLETKVVKWFKGTKWLPGDS